MARRSKLSKETIDAAIDLISKGHYDSTVYNFLGISHSTWYNWMKEGEKLQKGKKSEVYTNPATKELLVYFVSAVREAKAHAEMEALQDIKLASKKGPQYWKAAAYFLEKKFPERWRKNRKVSNDQNEEALKQFLEGAN